MKGIVTSVCLLWNLPAILSQTASGFEGIQAKFCSWECMKFTLMWPGTYCVSLKKLKCSIPANVKGWTIHGLWPMIHNENCCDCWPIFRSDLDVLEPQLSMLWPTLIQNKSSFSFWQEEWRRHGACAGCVEGMNSPTKYFQTALKLRGNFDVDRALQTAGVFPSCNVSYNYNQLYSTLRPIVGDVLTIQCVQDHKGRQVWVQLKITMTKTFTLGCNKLQASEDSQEPPGHPCPRTEPIFYFPIHRENPAEPCK
ncbi:ribonuclease T2-like [Erpetoichthys calabaricus]|uniref:Ribonuclease T2, like n=1 Tax=Erpetoichthys calabaricus TaxID=27687 RepID=A0A8C4XF91_ERPCA|nr:ribonuclease T2-like [Erpetoichthys calabaricus]